MFLFIKGPVGGVPSVGGGHSSHGGGAGDEAESSLPAMSAAEEQV